LKEIIQDIIKLKIQNLSNPKSNEFSNRLKQIVGKSFDELELKELISAKDEEIKEKIISKFSDSRKERIKLLGEDYAKEIEKRIFLQSIDLNWKSHIQYLEQLRQVIGLRSYGQRDPLIEYKKEAFDLFSNLLDKLKLDFVTILINLKVVTEQQEENKKSMVDQIKSGKKIGRNEPCSCGSEKKFKHCCGAL
jgi:preprotein translocase subunit SecA